MDISGSLGSCEDLVCMLLLSQTLLPVKTEGSCLFCLVPPRSLSDGQCVQDSLCLGGFFASGRAGILGLQCPIRKTLSSVVAGTPPPPPGFRGATLALANLFLIASSPG